VALTMFGGPLSRRVPDTRTFTVEGPAHSLLLEPFTRRVRAVFLVRARLRQPDDATLAAATTLAVTASWTSAIALRTASPAQSPSAISLLRARSSRR